jgi:hypothetical protein
MSRRLASDSRDSAKREQQSKTLLDPANPQPRVINADIAFRKSDCP